MSNKFFTYLKLFNMRSAKLHIYASHKFHNIYVYYNIKAINMLESLIVTEYPF